MIRAYFISARNTDPATPSEADMTVANLGDFDSWDIAQEVAGRLLDESSELNTGGIQEKALGFDLKPSPGQPVEIRYFQAS